MATLEDVAKKAGVSRSTVSRVINGQAHVAAQTRERVRRVIRELGYHPHSLARGLVTKRTRVVAMVIPETVSRLFSDQFFSLLLEGAVQGCNGRGYQLLLALFDNPQYGEKLYAQVLQNGYAEGVVIASTSPQDPLLHALHADRIPTVAVGRQPGFPYVDADNYRGGKLATEHLLSMGYRRIGTITGPLDHLHVQDRLEGYRASLEQAGIPFQEKLVAEGKFTEAGAMAATRQLLSVDPDALFVQSDTMAAAVLHVLKEEGIRVPQDIAVVSFDDLPLASLVDPPLTTVRQPIRMLGFMAVELLLHILEGKQDRKELVLPVELVVRASCGALARKNTWQNELWSEGTKPARAPGRDRKRK